MEKKLINLGLSVIENIAIVKINSLVDSALVSKFKALLDLVKTALYTLITSSNKEADLNALLVKSETVVVNLAANEVSNLVDAKITDPVLNAVIKNVLTNVQDLLDGNTTTIDLPNLIAPVTAA
jgi:hypothetical protein